MFSTNSARRRSGLLVALCLGTALLTGQAQADGHDGGPALWALSDDDNTVYLFGTFHLLPKDTNWQTGAVKKALADTTITVTEADTSSDKAKQQLQMLVAQYGLNPPGTSLSQILGDERASTFNTLAQSVGLDPNMLQPLRPWLALLSVTQAAYAGYGFNPELGVEAVILEQASADGDTIETLETLERQIKALSGLEDNGLMEFVDVSLEQFEDLEAQINEGVEAWMSGDVEHLDESLIATTRVESPRAFELIFASRNREWIGTIMDYLDGDTDTFIAVGTGHLVGEDSVIDLLAKKGIEAKRVQ